MAHMDDVSPKTRGRPPKFVRRCIRLRNQLTLHTRWALQPRSEEHNRATPLIAHIPKRPFPAETDCRPRTGMQ